MPAAAPVQVVVPAASRSTPKSVAAYRSPVTSSRTRSLIGMSFRSYDRSTQVDVPVAGLYMTSKTWPGVFMVYPLYEMKAWFPFAGSTWMLLTNLFGVTASSSSRVHETAAAALASTLREMNTRPVVVAAHAVDVSAEVRSTAATAPPDRTPQNEPVSGLPPACCQSPHTPLKVPVHVLQTLFASASVRLPSPNVLVRKTVFPVPANIVPLTLGSLMTGA